MARKNQKHRREKRRKDAEARQAARDSRTVDEQLRLIAQRPGESKREWQRLCIDDMGTAGSA